MNIQPISPITAPTELGQVKGIADGSKSSNFSDVLVDVVQSANKDLQNADSAIVDFETGKSTDLNSVVMASVKADLSFRFLMELRNRATESYQELSRMQF